MKLDYITVCHSNLLKDLPGRQKQVISRRFGLRGQRETLEAIGQDMGITRERVRQIEEDALESLKNRMDLPLCRQVSHHFTDYLRKNSHLKKEEILLDQLGGDRFKNHVFFLLTLSKPLIRVSENKDFHALWATNESSLKKAAQAVDHFVSKLEKEKKPLALPVSTPASYIEISKKVLMSQDGLYGLPDWPEIRPRGVGDKAYILLKKEKKPLHFNDVATLVNHDVVQTVHNELIKDSRFVLVGRGLYALREWGYSPGAVREVIAKELQESKEPLAKEEILQRVLKQRQVQPNTIFLNLQNKKFFIKNSDGKYTIRRV